MIHAPAYCIKCNGEFRLFTAEWPAKVMVCPCCSTPMKLLRQKDEKTCLYTTFKN